MLRCGGLFKPERRDVNFVFLNGGVGDHVGGSLIVVDYILKKYPWINLLIWVPDFLKEFSKHVLPKGAIVRNYTEMKTKYNRDLTTLNTAWDGRFSPMKSHHTTYAFNVGCDETPTIEKMNYLQIHSDKIDISMYKFPKNYVVLPTGYTAPVREFNAKTVNEITSYLVKKDITPVFLGQKFTKTGATHVIQGQFNEEIDFSRGIDLIDRTTLLQAAKIMKGAKAVVGVDCGLLHVAACTEVPIVGGFTTVRPEHRLPVRNNVMGWHFYPVVPDDSLECRFCQSDTNFLYGHDYKYCIYKDYQCVSQLNAEQFIEKLQGVL